VILVADVLEDLLVGRELEDAPHLPGTQVRTRVVDGDLDLQVPQVGPSITRDDVRLLRLRPRILSLLHGMIRTLVSNCRKLA
jgi:hypothetical protein